MIMSINPFLNRFNVLFIILLAFFTQNNSAQTISFGSSGLGG